MKFDAFSPQVIPKAARRFDRVAVIGAGSWGTALASTLAYAGVDTCIWARRPEIAREIHDQKTNEVFLPDVPLAPSLTATSDMAAALSGAEGVLIVVPARAIRRISQDMAQFIGAHVPVAVCAKGVEAETGFLMTQVVKDALGERPIGCVSGPTFARETALRHPTAATVAFPFSYTDRLRPHESAAARLALSLTTESFRTYVSDDVVGVEVGGAIKNVIAIACGMMTGAGFAENTRAALITRGLDEMKRLTEALGGQRETLSGLSGIGDLTLTCSTPTSRNMSLGLQLGRGLRREDCFDGQPVVVEGEGTASSVMQLARTVGVDMPICETVRSILHDGVDIGSAFAALWARPLEAEPRAMDLALPHPATEKDVQDFAKRIA